MEYFFGKNRRMRHLPTQKFCSSTNDFHVFKVQCWQINFVNGAPSNPFAQPKTLPLANSKITFRAGGSKTI
jgi:hypothetical protein